MHDRYDRDFYPYFYQLNAKQQEVYKELLPVIQRAMTEYAPKFQACPEDVYEASRAIYNDRPELFWLKSGGSSVTTVNGIVTEYRPLYNDLYKRRKEYNEELKEAAKELLRGLGNKSNWERERIVHDRMARHMTYKHSDLDQTAYSALVKQNAVCGGYSRAFQLMMHFVDIPCYYIYGIAKNKLYPNGELHAWNIVKLDSDYYAMDITWDDAYNDTKPDKIAYDYYNVTEDVIANDHKRDPECRFLPKCTGTKYSFTNVNGGVSNELEIIYQDGVTYKKLITGFGDYAKLAEAVVAKAKKGKVVFSFPTSQKKIVDKPYDEIKKALTNNKKRYESMSCRHWDYKNGLYKIEMTIVIK